jgi:acetyltransferase-like isoleucine patch superfamily enzyme
MLIRKKRVPIVQMFTIGLLPSWLKVWYYRVRGARIGRGVSIGFFTVFIARELRIGEGTEIGFGTVVRGRTVELGRHVKIGSMTFLDVEKIFIDDDSKINEQVFAGGPMLPESELRIGKNCIVMQYSFLNTTKPLIIGDGTGIGGHCLLFTHGSWQSELDGYPVTFAPITIGNNVWLPWRVFVLPGVQIGDNTTIGAGSLVTRNIPAGSLAAGMPAQVLRSAPDYPKQPSGDQRRNRLERILNEFFTYLEYHRFRIEKSPTPYGFDATVHGKRVFTIRVGSAGTVPMEDEGKTNSVTTLSLCGQPESEADKGTMRLDVARSTRTGSNELGEELVHFLSRYGVRFYRTD